MSKQSHDKHDTSHGGAGLYFGVFFGLILLTMCSFLTYFDFWRESVPVNVSRAFMMAVSCTKAMLVILFFMHLKWEASWKWVLTVPASVMSALLILALVPDVGLRMRHASHTRMIHAAERPAEETSLHSLDKHNEHNQEEHTPDHHALEPAA